MNNVKNRITRLEKRIGAADGGPRTFSDVVRWTTERQDAAGNLSPEDRDKSAFYFKRLFDESGAGRRR